MEVKNNLLNIKKNFIAFTLAEVLITLGIIGIVAAMTIPTLIQDYQKKVTVTKVKRMYSILSNAFGMAIAENGSVDTWDYDAEYTATSAMQFFEYIRPYIKIAKDNGTSSSNMMGNDTYRLLNGTGWIYYAKDSTYYKFMLLDGSIIWLRTHSKCNKTDEGTENVCAVIWYDVNGTNAPNQMGKDTFLFQVLKDGVITHGKDDCYLNNNGWGCSRFIIQNGHMDYPETAN